MIDLIIALSDQKHLAQRIAQLLDVPIAYAQVTSFADGEVAVTLDERVQYRGLRIALVHSLMPQPAQRVLMTASIAYALRNAGARDLVAIIPYLAYCRQTSFATAPLTSIAHLFAHAGISALYTVQPHSVDIQQYFPMPVIRIDAPPLIAQLIRRNHAHEKFVLVAPDQGARALVQSIADELCVPVVQCIKERAQPDQAHIVRVEGEHHADIAIVIDDMIDTGGTACAVQRALTTHGYRTFYGYFVHPVCAGNALDTLIASGYAHIFICNTIEHVYAASSQVTIVDSSQLIGAALTS
jgi:ribose-phosphate pyrophosphokinase